MDDHAGVADALDIALRIAGHRLEAVRGPEEAYSRLATTRFDAVLLDMNFTAGESDGAEGMACLARLVTDDPSACIVVVTAHSAIRVAVAAMQAGARDFVMKPWRNAELVAKIEAAVTRTARSAIAAPPAAAEPPARLLGESAPMQRLRDLIHRLGPRGASVAITGPAGSGRTLTAHALHAASADAAAPLRRIDLRDEAAWPRLGDAAGPLLLRHPDRLDEVAQARLLDQLPAHVRCLSIADSLVPLTPALQRRLGTVEIAVPPLAARGGDAVLLARHFARLATARFGLAPVRLTDAAEAAVQAGTWADEVRGLALAVERAVLLAEGGEITAALLAPQIPAPVVAVSEGRFDLVDAERAVIAAALREHRHNVTQAAAALGLSRGALYRRMARHGF
ncbi:sigma-54-dependent transcriptional regulator [Roseateles cellulosilyticus]|uniref:Response regulator n=1 Tax=Pelomonas cellulosilytica TaxID=2906762 RepID=A0ABS8XTS9_9BURK|nr:response regulator [Pelomonas sp. P8]